MRNVHNHGDCEWPAFLAHWCNLPDLQLEIEDANASASYDLSVTHGLESLAEGESAELDFDDPGFAPTSAKLNYTLDDGSYGTSSLTIK